MTRFSLWDPAFRSFSACDRFEPWEVLEGREDFEIKEEDLVEFSTDGILTDINLAGTTPDEELGLLHKRHNYSCNFLHACHGAPSRRKCWLPSTQLESCKQGEIERNCMDYLRKNASCHFCQLLSLSLV